MAESNNQTVAPDDQACYTIGELAELAGVTPRTIRYYTAEGLLPPPDTQNKYARYSAEHLTRLRLIARLKDAYLPLHEIRQRIAPLDAAEVAAMLGETSAQPRQIAEQSSASDYIVDVIARQQAVQPSAPPQSAPQMRASTSVPPASVGVPARGGFLRALLPKREPAPNQGKTWQRTTLAPGVELHVREPPNEEQQSLVARVLAVVHGNKDASEGQS